MNATKWLCKDCTRTECCFSKTNMPIESCYLYKPRTHADYIRAMSDERLAEFLGDWAQRHRVWMCDSQGECLAWLQEPAKEEE